jgi:hypothetical protein
VTHARDPGERAGHGHGAIAGRIDRVDEHCARLQHQRKQSRRAACDSGAAGAVAVAHDVRSNVGVARPGRQRPFARHDEQRFEPCAIEAADEIGEHAIGAAHVAGVRDVHHTSRRRGRVPDERHRIA